MSTSNPPHLPLRRTCIYGRWQVGELPIYLYKWENSWQLSSAQRPVRVWLREHALRAPFPTRRAALARLEDALQLHPLPAVEGPLLSASPLRRLRAGLYSGLEGRVLVERAGRGWNFRPAPGWKWSDDYQQRGWYEPTLHTVAESVESMSECLQPLARPAE